MKNSSTKSHEPLTAHTNRTTDSKAVLKSFLLAFLLLCGHFTLSAATITVTNGNDAGAGSLRQAIVDAVAGDDIAFSGVTTVTLTSAELTINKNLTINGGAGVTITRDVGAPNFRIFNITSGSATVVFNKLSITNGKAIPPVGNQAAGIQNSGTLTLNDCIIANNESGVQSGGIQNDKILTMNRCFVYNNSATTAGGGSGLLIYGSSTTLNNCVFTNNQGAYAIDVRASGTLTITNCTIAKNTNGGINIGNGSAVVTLKNTIVAENTAASSPNINGNNLSSSAYNLIGTEGGNGGLTNGTNNNIVGISPMFANSSDPDGADNIFGTADDGLMLTACNFATNVGNNADAPSGTDVAGNTRIFNTTVDIGAYEFQANSSPYPTITLGTIPAILAGATSFTIPYTATSSPTTYSISGTGFSTLTDAALPSSPITVNLSPAASISIDFTLTVKNANGCTSNTVTEAVVVNTPLTQACATATFNGTAPIAPTATTAGVGGRGGIHTYTVPAGVTAIRLDAKGAKGGSSPNHFNNIFVGGQGGRVQATYAVTPGDVLYILVGGKGGDGTLDDGITGRTASGGGGATVVSKGTIGLGTLLLVAGGGGGAGRLGGGGNSNNAPNSGAGFNGAGGASFSADGGNSTTSDGCGKGGQALNAGGNGGANTCFRPETNGGGYGGGGAGNYNTNNGNAGGGGGGGYVGGNAGATAGGNGGSSFTDPNATNVTTNNHSDDNGSVVISVAATISYTGSPFCKTLTATAAPTTSGYTGGTFSAIPTGLTIDATTGVINPSTSTAGSYLVSYNTFVGCPAATTIVKIQAITTPSVSISPMAICVGTSPTLTATATNGGSSPQFYWSKNNEAQGISDFVNKRTADGLGNNTVYGVYVDNAGTIYAATNGGGLSISSNGGTSFITKTTANGLGGNFVYGVYVDNAGTIYAATLLDGLSISSNGGTSFITKTTANGLGDNTVNGVYVDKNGTIYAATNGGLSISSNGGSSFSNKTTVNGLGNNLVRGVYVDNAGKIYAATQGGLSISTDGGTSFSNKTTTANGLGSNNVYGVYVDNAGTIYAATQGGLSISTDGGATFSNKSLGGIVRGVYVDNAGTIYAVTQNVRLHISTDGGTSFINKTSANGLGNGSLSGVHVGTDGTIYVATAVGLSIASQATGNSLAVTSAVAGDVYKVTLVSSADACPSFAAAMASVTVNTSLLSLSTPTVGNILCQGGSTTISAVASGGSGGYQYSLNGGAFQTNPVFTVQAGSYTITAKDGGGCTGTTALITVRDGTFALQCPSSTTVEAAQMGANGTVPTSVSGNATIFGQCITIAPNSMASTDQIFDVNCGVVSPQTNNFSLTSLVDMQKAIVRTFAASAGVVTYSCHQNILVRQPKLEDVVFPANRTLTCANLRTEPTDAFVNNATVTGTGSPISGSTILNTTVSKGLTATYTDVRTTTPTGFTIQRTWTVTKCVDGNVQNNTIRTFVQTITVPTCTTPSMSGSIGRENGTAIPATTLLYNSTTGKTDSTTGTTYSFGNLLTNSNVRVKPTRPNTDWTSGVTMLDVSLLSRHVLDINPLTSPYSIISSDVNSDGEVDATDMLLLQRLILRLIPALPNNNSWRFVLKNHIFRNPSAPLASDFPEVLVVSNLSSALANGDFVAIKVGDLNQSAGVVNIRGGAKAFVLNTEDLVLEKGKTYQIPIQLTPSVSSLQFTLNVDKTAAKIENIENGNLPNFTDNNRGLFQKEGIITAAWTGKDGKVISETDNFTMMTVTLTPTKTTRLSEIMTINSAYTEGVAYDAKGTGFPVQLAFGNQKASGEKAVLLPNRPNPFSNETVLSFILPEASTAKLTVCDLLGKVLMVRDQVFAKGLNEVVFDATKTPSVSSGIFIVRLQTASGVMEQKIVLQR